MTIEITFSPDAIYLIQDNIQAFITKYFVCFGFK